MAARLIYSALAPLDGYVADEVAPIVVGAVSVPCPTTCA
jgi:hypothetical protein